MIRGINSRSFLYAISCLPTGFNEKEAAMQSKVLVFRPAQLKETLETLQTTAPSEKVVLMPIQHYNSLVFNKLFEELLNDKTLNSKNITINIPWASPGSWVGCNSRCEELELEVMKNFNISRQLI